MDISITSDHRTGLEIAIIGMVGRFPQARNVDEFWSKVRDGVSSITTLSDQELAASGVAADELYNPNYVKAKGVLEDIELFDASFFDYSPRDAAIMDPQHRHFLECAYEALENAGYDPDRYDGLIGVFAGTSMNSYLLANLCTNPELIASIGGLELAIGSDKDHLTTRVSYKLNLQGPSLDVNTSCSTSLVAVHLACRSLLNGECDMALAGGVSITVPQKVGYLYQEGGITSPDGCCRAFDANAQGAVPGSGLGIVVLKRLEDAIADGDFIHACIKGSAINNDGAMKVGYTAPSVKGQARVIRAAQLAAEVEAETITYVETHGTGTPLGDPIEVAALTQAFRESTGATGFCAIGSVKTNLGHLDAAAGVAGLIKTVQALKHALLPPSLHFEQPNPRIDFARSPFYVNTRLSEWKRGSYPRRAGISSFGIGGTNAHVVLEEAPVRASSRTSRSWHLLVLSAKTVNALETMTANLAAHLEQRPALSLPDVTYTCQVGRKVFPHRRVLVYHDRDEIVKMLRTLPPGRVFSSSQEMDNRPVAFMFPGQGTQYVHMAAAIYQEEPVFREELERCSILLKPFLGLDLRHVLYPSEVSEQLHQTSFTQPALFALEYALAKLWMHWGIQPQAMIGHSIGEYVAACLAGVFSLEDALALVARRGQLMQKLPGGTMLSVPLSEAAIRPLLSSELSLAANNGPSLCVVAGPTPAIAALQNSLAEQGVACHRLHSSRAFHSAMMEPIIQAFAQYVSRIPLRPPQIPYISNITGTWMTASDAIDPTYWARHLRKTVRFAEGVQKLLEQPERILLEVGPGQTLSTLARQNLDKTAERWIFSSLGPPQDHSAEGEVLFTTLGKLWLAGAPVEWPRLYTHERRLRVPLPTYPFERQRYWVEPRGSIYKANVSQAGADEKSADDGERPKPVTSGYHRPNLLNEYVAPDNEIERNIAEIWQELLGIEQIGTHDSFFDLGGHSLLATRLSSRLHDTFDVQLELRTFFERPTIAELATIIIQNLAEQVDSELLAKLEHLTQEEVQATLATEHEMI
jgi:phthiocerol/phenolphthiocerol synthesis type-I polyketide synthase E